MIFGAGASAGTAGLPASRDFGAELARARAHWARAFPHLARLVRSLPGSRRGGWDLSQAWTRLDYLDRLGWALDDSFDRAAASVELRRALLTVYGRHGPDLARRVARGHSQTARDLLREVSPGDVLISFNYDVLLEHLARAVGLHLVQAPCEACPRRAHRCVQLVKPHGSLSWRVEVGRRGTRVQWRGSQGAPLQRPLRPEQVNAGSRPLVVGAVPIKAELLHEPRQGAEASPVHEVIVAQWRSALAAVRRAERAVVLGYSFPPEDQYAAFLFREAARARRRPLRVEFFEVEAQAEVTAGRLLDVFGVWPTWRRQV